MCINSIHTYTNQYNILLTDSYNKMICNIWSSKIVNRVSCKDVFTPQILPNIV